MPLLLDETTQADLAIFHDESNESVFQRFDFTRTSGGKKNLKKFFSAPSDDIEKIRSVQELLGVFADVVEVWPSYIANGTVFIMERFCTEPYTGYNPKDNLISRLSFQFSNQDSYCILKFSVKIFSEFFRGLSVLLANMKERQLPGAHQHLIEKIKKAFEEKPIQELAAIDPVHKFTSKENFYFGYHLRVNYRNLIKELIEVFCQMEAWYSIAFAIKKYNLKFPQFIEGTKPYFRAEGLYHLMVENARSYSVNLWEGKGLLFLTGSNMAGKSTFIKSVGLSLFLAHLGIGVPAESMTLSAFGGLSTNINISDDITKGQSYFFNEVSRIKETILKIRSGSTWMILVDEIFKGTNVLDAMRCSVDVINGFSKVENALFVISTHLYEIAKEFKYPDKISCKHMETIVDGDEFRFTYKIKDGVSNERIGFSIMKREGVIQMLQDL